MSARYYCDVCEKEIEKDIGRIKRKLGDISVEVMVAVKGCWNGGHVCHDCVIEAVKKGKTIERGRT